MTAAFALRASALAILWWVLVEGRHDALWMAVPVVLAGAYVSVLLRADRARLRAGALLRFTVFFLRESLRGGVDVALRAVRPQPRLRPALVAIRLRLPPGPARVLLADLMSLLPGTLSAALEDDRLIMHVLDERMPLEPSLRTAEAHVAGVFGIGLHGDERA